MEYMNITLCYFLFIINNNDKNKLGVPLPQQIVHPNDNSIFIELFRT